MKTTLRNALALLAAAAFAQQAVAQNGAMLTLSVVSGDAAINNIHHPIATPAVVEVRDETGQPIKSAAVTFTLPPRGPSGAFVDGSHSWTGTTDAQGRVTLPRFAPNRLEGSYQILVSATAAPRSGTALIRQTNVFSDPVPEKRGMRAGTKMLMVLGIGAAVAAGSLLALKGSSVGDHAAVPPTSVSLGPISIGAPH